MCVCVCQVLDTGWVELLAPDLDQIFSACTTMRDWLQTHPKHVLVLHCRVNVAGSSAHTDTDVHFESITRTVKTFIYSDCPPQGCKGRLGVLVASYIHICNMSAR